MEIGGITIIFQEITLEDKKLFDEYFSQKRFETSESTFANLFMWRNCYKVEWALIEDILTLKPNIKDEIFIVPVIGNDTSRLGSFLDIAIKYFEEQNLPLGFRGVTKEALELIEKAKPNTFAFTEDRNVFDYMYSAESLIELKGRKFSRKRNHIKNFKKTYPHYQYKDLTEDLIPEAIEFIKEWCRKKGCEDDVSLLCERDATIEALTNFEVLGFTGGTIIIDGKIEAITFGEALNNDTVIVHVEKGNRDINGIYPVINQEYLVHNWQNMTYVNREEDLGVPELRKAKEAYYPLRLVEKYRGALKE